ncbi:MAG: hypothetical protein AB7U73_15335 [Pirellulales bacterium]
MALDRLIARVEAGGQLDGPKLRKLAPAVVTVGELREAIAAYPEHPVAQAYALAVDGRPDERRLTVDRNDLLALCTNCAVVTHEEWTAGGVEISKSVGGPLAGGQGVGTTLQQIAQSAVERVDELRSQAAAEAVAAELVATDADDAADDEGSA